VHRHRLVYEPLEPAAVCSSHAITTPHHRPALGCFSCPAIAAGREEVRLEAPRHPWRVLASRPLAQAGGNGNHQLGIRIFELIDALRGVYIHWRPPPGPKYVSVSGSSGTQFRNCRRGGLRSKPSRSTDIPPPNSPTTRQLAATPGATSSWSCALLVPHVVPVPGSQWLRVCCMRLHILHSVTHATRRNTENRPEDSRLWPSRTCTSDKFRVVVW
jgi:hypothetical protein